MNEKEKISSKRIIFKDFFVHSNYLMMVSIIHGKPINIFDACDVSLLLHALAANLSHTIRNWKHGKVNIFLT
jgi:hypothetical protein